MAVAKKSKASSKGLGKGLGNLIRESEEDENVVVKEVVKEVVVKEPGEMKVRLSQIEPNREQPRKVFDEDALIELSESIKQYGVLQPLLVQKKDKYYEIIAGERRWRAAKLAGVKEVPVIIKDYSTQEVMEIALIENIQREDLNPIEEAQAYQRLIKDYRLKQDEVAEKDNLRLHGYTGHSGADFSCPTGSKVVAAESGTVIISADLYDDNGNYRSYGRYIVIKHDKTTSSGAAVYTLYAHNSERLVSAGQHVEKGQQIAKSGSTGNSTGPHCHFEVRTPSSSYSDCKNPANYLP